MDILLHCIVWIFKEKPEQAPGMSCLPNCTIPETAGNDQHNIGETTAEGC